MFLLWAVAVVQVQAQTHTVEARVVNAKTGVPVGYANVYATSGQGTITNADGDFRLTVTDTAHVRISFVGYETVYLPVRVLGPVVRLREAIYDIAAVTILPSGDRLATRVVKKALKEFRRSRKERGNYFYRQVTQTDSVCNEYIEAFFWGRTSFCFPTAQLLEGRYAGLPSDSIIRYQYVTNFFTLSQLAIVTPDIQAGIHGIIQPLRENFLRYYKVTYNTLRSSSPSTPDCYVLYFDPLPIVSSPILQAVVYVDMKTLGVLRCEGNLLGLTMQDIVTGEEHDFVAHLNFSFRRVGDLFDPKTHDALNSRDSYSQLSSVSATATTTFIGRPVRLRSVLYNLGQQELSGRAQPDFSLEIGAQTDLKTAINHTAYNASFWQQNEFVKRTELEETVLRMMEGNRLFSNYR